MLEKILRFSQKLIPKRLYKLGQPIYHFLLAILGMLIYGFPAKKMTIIAVTGTKGKTSTVNFIQAVLSAGGEKVGLISTANIKILDQEILNKSHMSTLGRFDLQILLKKMLKAGCKIVVVEVTSEGIKQFRHLGLFIDIAVFTNLSPEHLESHGGSFEKYKQTKMRIFKQSVFNKLKMVLINADDKQALSFKLQAASGIETLDFSLKQVSDIHQTDSGTDFKFEQQDFHLNILGKINIYNALPAILLGQKFNLNYQQIRAGLLKLNIIPGRMEEIKMGQDFKVFVDYAHEKVSINILLDFARDLIQPYPQPLPSGGEKYSGKIILVLGGTGGGRDRQNLFDLGYAAGQKADTIIITNSDPYFDNQLELAEIIFQEAIQQNIFRENNGLEKLELNKNIFIILDRGLGIKKAIQLAKFRDIVLLATRGSLVTMQIQGQEIKSKDSDLVREVLSRQI